MHAHANFKVDAIVIAHVRGRAKSNQKSRFRVRLDFAILYAPLSLV